MNNFDRRRFNAMFAELGQSACSDSIFWVLRFDPGINRGGKVLTIHREVQDIPCQIKS